VVGPPPLSQSIGGGEGAEESEVGDGFRRLVVGLYLRACCERSQPAIFDGDKS